LADLKRIQDEPIPLANAGPSSDADLSLWNGVIGCEMEVTHIGLVTVPLHFLIDFPSDYPASAPNIGFSFEFGYRSGASYTEQSGRLKGKKVICLDILGNFGHVHTEWKSTVGSGWSPAYTVSTLLIQLQSVLCNLGTE
jgi:ubiquitin-protein ligase